jgi:hypothetical protein
MTPAYPQWPGFPLPFPGRRGHPPVSMGTIGSGESGERLEVPDHHSQLEELLSHVRRCERWAQLDDRIDLGWRLDGNR